jgi:hypothetical protein
VSPQTKLTDPGMVVKGDPMAIPEYAVTPPGLANAIPQESDFKNGFQLLALEPDVERLWKDAWEVVQTA